MGLRSLSNFICEVDYGTYRKRTNRISSKMTDWKGYKENLENCKQEFVEQEIAGMKVVDRYNKIIGMIRSSTRLASGKSPLEGNHKELGRAKQTKDCKLRKNPVSWWDLECSKVNMDRNKARKNDEKIRNNATKIEYSRCIAVARKVINEKKREGFGAFTSSLNRFADVGYVWRKMNTFKNRENRQKWGNKGNKEYERICRNEMDKVAPPWSEERPVDLLE